MPGVRRPGLGYNAVVEVEDLGELLGELRVALPGVQVLFAFLLVCRSTSASAS